MKKIGLLFMATMLLAFGAQAQSSSVAKFFDKYGDSDEFTTVSVTGRMFDLMVQVTEDSEESAAIKEVAEGLKGLKILTSDKGDSRSLYNEVMGSVSKANFEELMSIKEGKGDIKFMIQEKDKVITELIMVSGGDEEFMLLTMYGKIDLEAIAKISKNMNINGLENLKKLDQGN